MRSATFFLFALLLLFVGCSEQDNQIKPVDKIICGYKTSPNGTEEPLYDCPVKINIDVQEVKKITSNNSEKLNLTSKTINKTDLNLLIFNKTKPYDTNSKVYYDREYHLYNLDLIKEKLKELHHKNYTAEIYDCDDFAIQTQAFLKKEFPGIAAGVISVSKTAKEDQINISDSVLSEITYFQTNNSWYYGNGSYVRLYHAANIIIDSEFNVWYYEPQRNEFMPISEREYQTIERWII